MVGIGVVLSIHFHQRQTMPNKKKSPGHKVLG